MTNYKIMIVAPTAYTLGGVAVWLDYLLRGLNDRGIDIVFGAVNGEYHNSSKYLEMYPFVNTCIISNPSGTSYGRVQAVKQAIVECDPQIVVSVNIPDVYAASRDLKATSHPGLKVVSTLHGLEPNLFNDIELYNDCIDSIVVTNALTKIMLDSFCQLKDKPIYYAPYGVLDQPARKLVANNKPLRLLYSGRIDNTQKRCADLIGIVSELEVRGIDYQLTLVGDGPYKKTLLENIASIADQSKVCDLGVLPASEMVEKAYLQSDILLVTSDWETGPIVIWEAMVCGMLVVTSRYNGLSAEGALVDEKNCLIFDVGNTTSAVDKLEQLIESKVSFSSIVNKAYQLIEQRYSRIASLNAWMATFQTISELDTSTDDTSLIKNKYSVDGLLERVFGVKLATRIRPLIGKPALVNSPGSEWPHRHSNVDTAYIQRFSEVLKTLNKNELQEAQYERG